MFTPRPSDSQQLTARAAAPAPGGGDIITGLGSARSPRQQEACIWGGEEKKKILSG